MIDLPFSQPFYQWLLGEEVSAKVSRGQFQFIININNSFSGKF